MKIRSHWSLHNRCAETRTGHFNFSGTLRLATITSERSWGYRASAWKKWRNLPSLFSLNCSLIIIARGSSISNSARQFQHELLRIIHGCSLGRTNMLLLGTVYWCLPIQLINLRAENFPSRFRQKRKHFSWISSLSWNRKVSMVLTALCWFSEE